MRMLIVCFERLAASELGCYGETRTPTPHFDRLAAESLVVEHLYLSPTLDGLLAGLRDRLPECRWTTLETVQAVRALHRGSPLVESTGSGTVSGIFLRAMPADEPTLRLAETIWTDPARNLWEDPDCDGRLPDESSWRRERAQQAAETMMQDRLLQELLEGPVRQLASDDLLIVTADAGNPASAREIHDGWLASVAEPAVHVPLMLRSNSVAAERQRGLLGRKELLDVLAALAGGEAETAAALPLFDTRSVRQLTYESRQARAVRTERWLLVERLEPAAPEVDVAALDDEGAPEMRLFRKPEDYWESFDVAFQFPELVEGYRQTGRLNIDANPD